MGIQINQKDNTKTFMMISNWKKNHLRLNSVYKIFQRFNPLTAGVAYIRVLIFY